MANWVTEAEANTYMVTRYGASTFWATGVDKLAAITTAQSNIENSPRFSGIPAVATQGMKDAVCEQALFLVQHRPDRRVGLQAQGVTHAGIVQETYREEDMGKVPICPAALDLLKTAGALAPSIRMGDVERDEEEDV